MQAFDGITLYRFATGMVEMTPLNVVQQTILDLLHIPKTIYAIPDDYLMPPAAS